MDNTQGRAKRGKWNASVRPNVDSWLGTRTVCAGGPNVNLRLDTRADGEVAIGRGDVVSLCATMVIAGVRRCA